jgi:hypothetical protein
VFEGGQTFDVAGALTVDNCQFSGPAAAPLWSAVTGFQGTVNGAGAGGVFGPISSHLTIDYASPNEVTGEWTLDLRANAAAAGVTASGPASFIALRNGDCPAKGPSTPPWPNGRIMNGTPDHPTTVHVQVDQSVSSNPALNGALEKAITNWNATLGEAGRNIEFTTASGAGPVVRIGVDSPTFDQSVHGSAVSPDHAAETEVVSATTQNGINYTDVANVILKSPGLSASEPWSSVSSDLIQHVMLHELGHVLGMNDVTAANASDSIMWGKKGTLRTQHPTTVACADIRALQGL